MVCKLLSIGHILIDTRVRVSDFGCEERENKILDLNYGVGGSAANVAIGFTRLGGRCTLVGKIGMDSFGRMAVDELMKENIGLDHVKVDMIEKTGFSIVLINSRGEISLFGSKGAAENLEPADIISIKPGGCEYAHIASLRMDTSIAAAELAKRDGLFVTFDPGRELSTRGIQFLIPIFPHLDLLLLNSKEALALTGIEDPEQSAAALRKAGAKNVIVKLGGRGVYFLTDKDEGIAPAYKVEAIDTTGAGDAFATGLLISLGEGFDFKEAIRYASAVAAIKVTRLGSHSIPAKKEVEEFLSSVKV